MTHQMQPTEGMSSIRPGDAGIDPESSTYHRLACAKCGVLLSPKTTQHRLVCYQCGHSHPFLMRDTEHVDEHYHVGQAVAVEWGGLWWHAHVVETVDTDIAWRVHFSGWGPSFDAVVDRLRICSIDDMPHLDNPIDSASGEPDDVDLHKEETMGMNPIVGIIIILLTFLVFAIIVLLSDPANVPDIPQQLYPPGINASNWVK